MGFSEHLVNICVGIMACQTLITPHRLCKTVQSLWDRGKQSHTEYLGISETLKGVAVMVSHAVYVP